MNADTVLGWMEKGLAKTAEGLGANPEMWWPAGQTEATNWMWATMFEAAKATAFESSKLTTLCAPLGGRRGSPTSPEAKQLREGLIAEWRKGNELRAYWNGHDLLDFTFKQYDAAMPNVLAAESEMCADHSVVCDIVNMGDYAWDFFKLLQVPAKRRLMFARVAWRNRDRGEPESPREALFQGLLSLAGRYHSQFTREGDEIAVVVFADAGKAWSDVRCGVLRREGESLVRIDERRRWPGWDPDGAERAGDGAD